MQIFQTVSIVYKNDSQIAFKYKKVYLISYEIVKKKLVEMWSFFLSVLIKINGFDTHTGYITDTRKSSSDITTTDAVDGISFFDSISLEDELTIQNSAYIEGDTSQVVVTQGTPGR